MIEKISNNLQYVVPIMIVFLGLLCSLILYIYKFIKAIKNGKVDKAKDILNDMISDAMIQMENMQSKSGDSFTGSVKKMMVKMMVKNDCLSKGILYDDTVVDEKIEKVITTSNIINARNQNETHSPNKPIKRRIEEDEE